MQKKLKNNFNFLRKKIAMTLLLNGWQIHDKLHFANNLLFSLNEIRFIYFETLFHQ